jgi:hypothetical protein
MLHPSGISTIIVVFKLIDVNILTHCTGIENGVGEEMIHLIDAIMKTCSLAGIDSMCIICG